MLGPCFFFFFFFFFWGGGGGLGVLSTLVILLLMKRELVALLYFCCGCLWSVSLHQGAVGWPVVCVCGIFWSYSYTNCSGATPFPFEEQRPFDKVIQ